MCRTKKKKKKEVKINTGPVISLGRALQALYQKERKCVQLSEVNDRIVGSLSSVTLLTRKYVNNTLKLTSAPCQGH